jgi:hypothetical protein
MLPMHFEYDKSLEGAGQKNRKVVCLLRDTLRRVCTSSSAEAAAGQREIGLLDRR